MKVLFVCSGNAYRSPVAEALFKKLRPDVSVDSAGTNVVIPISDETIRYLTKENAKDLLKESPEDLDDKPLNEYHLIVAMEPRHKELILSSYPECAERIEVWNIEDPYFLPPGHTEKVFNKIKEKVVNLAQSL